MSSYNSSISINIYRVGSVFHVDEPKFYNQSFRGQLLGKDWRPAGYDKDGWRNEYYRLEFENTIGDSVVYIPEVKQWALIGIQLYSEV